jgi:hypothetical protein
MVLDGATRNKPLGPRVEQNHLPVEGWGAEEFGYHEFNTQCSLDWVTSVERGFKSSDCPM